MTHCPDLQGLRLSRNIYEAVTRPDVLFCYTDASRTHCQLTTLFQCTALPESQSIEYVQKGPYTSLDQAVAVILRK